jgi:hypothetical protein
MTRAVYLLKWMSGGSGEWLDGRVVGFAGLRVCSRRVSARRDASLPSHTNTYGQCVCKLPFHTQSLYPSLSIQELKGVQWLGDVEGVARATRYADPNSRRAARTSFSPSWAPRGTKKTVEARRPCWTCRRGEARSAPSSAASRHPRSLTSSGCETNPSSPAQLTHLRAMAAFAMDARLASKHLARALAPSRSPLVRARTQFLLPHGVLVRSLTPHAQAPASANGYNPPPHRCASCRSAA